jgi:hypothetical protein
LKAKWLILGLLLALSGGMITGCGPAAIEPTPAPSPTSAEETALLPGPAEALEVALAYLAETYGEQGPQVGLTWREERTTPQDLVGASRFQYTSGDWVVTVTYPIVAPAETIYRMTVSNQATGFSWEGEVDAKGGVTEGPSEQPFFLVPDADTAIDMALGYMGRRYGRQMSIPAPGLTWTGKQPQGERRVDVETIEFTSVGAPGWVITVSYPVVPPEQVIYQVVAIGQDAGFRWAGQVGAAGQVTELSVSIEQ